MIFVEGLWSVLKIFCSGIAMMVFLWILLGVLTSDGRVDYCYTSTWRSIESNLTYEIYGHRPWRFDTKLFEANTAEKADLFLQKSVVCSGTDMK